MCESNSDRLLQDALHNTHFEGVISVRGDNRRAAIEARVHHGRGVLVGLIASLMAAGASFDEAWYRLLCLKPDIYPACIPLDWPTLADYAASGDGHNDLQHGGYPPRPTNEE